MQSPAHLLRLLALVWRLARAGALTPFALLVPEKGLARWAYTAANRLARRDLKGRSGERLAELLCAQGPAFVKAGQALSTRPDLLGAQAAEDLTRLQDNLPPDDFDKIKPILEGTFEASIDEIFRDFHETAVSAASVAQVHFAQLNDGQEIAVKVIRPGVSRAFRRDVTFLTWLARNFERARPDLRHLKPQGILEEFARNAVAELDLRIEAAALSRFRTQFTADDPVVLPEPIWDLCGERVLVMTRVAGTPIDHRQTLIDEGHDLQAVLTRAAEVFFTSVLTHGYFHGDQHGGNMMIDKQGRVVFVDFGIMGTLPWRLRYFLADLMTSLLAQDYEALARRYQAAGYLGPDQDIDAFGLSVRAVAEPIMGKPLEQVSFGKLLGQLLAMSQQYRLEMQPELFLLQKNMLMAEGISRQLAPELNIWTLTEPLISDWARKNLGPVRQLRDIRTEGLKLVDDLPRLLRYLRKQVDTMEIEEREGRQPKAPLSAKPPRWLVWAALLLIGAVLGYAATHL